MSSATPRATSLWSRIAGGSKPPAWALVDFRDDRDDHEADRQVPATAPTAVLDGPLSPSPSSPPLSMLSPKDFKFLRDLGSGSWSTVMEAVHATTNKRYAVKILSKSQLIKQKKVQYANVEKDALAKLSGTHPGFVKMYAAFQDETSLYFVLELAPHGDLADLVKKSGSLSLRCSQWYTAQIVDAVLWMHSKGILHRDLKPENVLLDNEMRVKLTDLGSAYIAPQGDLSPRSSSFVGSAAYVSPELLDRTSKSTSNSSDIWAIGCTLCFMVAGTPPFAAANDYQTFRKIEALDYTYPEEFYVLARDLTQQLLVLDPSCRLGIEPKSSPALLRNHPFFTGGDDPELTPIRWDTLWKDAPVPPETGIVKPAPSLPAGGDDDDLWDNVVQNFSLVNIGSRADGSLSPTCPLPSGTPVDVPPDIAPCEVTETVYVSGYNPQDGVRQGDDDDLSDPALKAKDWSNILRPGESIRHVVSVQTTLRLGLSRQQRTCALLLTSLPGVLCVAFKEKDQAAKQSDVKHVLAFQESDDSYAKKCEKYEVIVSCSLEDSQQRLVLRTGEKEYRYEFAERNVLSGWQREIDCLVRRE